MIHTPTDQMLVKTLVKPQSTSSNITASSSNSVDCRGYTSALLIVHIGTHDRTNSDETLDVQIYESSDNSSFAAVSSGSITQIAAQTITANRGSAFMLNINLKKRLRYLAPQVTFGGTSPGADVFGITIVLFNAELNAPTQDVTATSI